MSVWFAGRWTCSDCHEVVSPDRKASCPHRPARVSFVHGFEPSRRRPRRDCPGCGRPGVAVMADGSLWPHKLPGWGLWSDGGDCKGGRG